MQVAAVLSDLKSLSVCPPDAAMRLVSTQLDREHNATNDQTSNTKALADLDQSSDPALQRAHQLLRLHQEVKVNPLQQGFDKDLIKAREDVQRVLAALNQIG